MQPEASTEAGVGRVAPGGASMLFNAVAKSVLIMQYMRSEADCCFTM
jgi:hypothetical protein